MGRHGGVVWRASGWARRGTRWPHACRAWGCTHAPCPTGPGGTAAGTVGAVGNVLRGLKARLASAGESLQPQMLPPLVQGVQLALEQVQYAARVIGRVRDYTRNHQPQREPLDTLTLLRSSLALLDWDLERHGVQWCVQEDGI